MLVVTWGVPRRPRRCEFTSDGGLELPMRERGEHEMCPGAKFMTKKNLYV